MEPYPARDRARARRPRPLRTAIARSLAELAAAERRTRRAHLMETAHALQEERLRRLERDVDDLRGRVHGLILIVAGAVVAQVVVRLFG